MSIERECSHCGKEEGIRINFACPEAEAEFHAKEYKCEAQKRKETPVKTGVLDYFPDAIRAVAQCSYIGNEQHNPGTALHWDRSKSGDELDALTRHLMDAGTIDTDGIRHSAKVAWRALANLQKEIEKEEELKLEDWQEELLEKYGHEDYMYDGEECDGELGSHPLCCTDYCPCKEEEIEKRMNIIGQNGNDGLHYDSRKGAGLHHGPCSMHAFEEGNVSDYPESNYTGTMTMASGDIEVTYEIQTPEGQEDS